MSFIVRKCSELSAYTKFGISGACTGLCYAFASTNPVTLAAVAAIPFLPDLMGRCMRRNVAPVVHAAFPQAASVIRQNDGWDEKEMMAAIEASTQPGGPALDVASAALIEQMLLQDAINASARRLRRDDVKETNDEKLDRAIAMSLEPQIEVPVYRCELSKILAADDDQIPDGLALASEGEDQYYNVAVFLQTLLAQDNNAKDILNKPVTEDMLGLAEDMIGFDQGSFGLLWILARDQFPVGGMSAEEAQLNVSRRSDSRARTFIQLLESHAGSADQLALRRQVIQYYKKDHNEWWVRNGGH